LPCRFEADAEGKFSEQETLLNNCSGIFGDSKDQVLNKTKQGLNRTIRGPVTLCFYLILQ